MYLFATVLLILLVVGLVATVLTLALYDVVVWRRYRKMAKAREIIALAGIGVAR